MSPTDKKLLIVAGLFYASPFVLSGACVIMYVVAQIIITVVALLIALGVHVYGG